MKQNKKLSSVLATVKTMDMATKKDLVDQIMRLMQMPSDEEYTSLSASCNDLVSEFRGEHPDCPHCQAEGKLGFVVKHGFKNGVQRYYCKVCGKHFVPNTKTVFSGTRKSSDVWEKFIKLTIEGASLHCCAEECNISYQTSFTWRHKILSVFKKAQEKTMMTGKVEMDEMLIPLNFKGNHIKGSDITQRRKGKDVDTRMPRVAFKRGTDRKSKSANDRACVFCMVQNGNKGFYGAVPGVGFMHEDMLDATFNKHVNKDDSVVCVDTYKITSNYLAKNNYKHIVLSSNTSNNHNEHIPEIQGEYHIQHVNAMHRQIRLFLSDYYGVSSKYLENYISLFVWLKNSGAYKRKKKIKETSVGMVASSNCYVSRRELEAMPSIPTCAA